MRGVAIPVDWYRTSFAENFQALYFAEDGGEKAELAMAMLGVERGARVLDLACATGQRTHELTRRGFEVIGVDIRAPLLEVAACEVEQDDLWPWFAEEDPRYMDFEEEFDIVLSLGGGAFEHFEYDEDSMRAFDAAARALRPRGRLLMQIPNVIFVERHLPDVVRLTDGGAEDVIEQHWNAPTHRLDGVRTSRLDEDPEWPSDAIPFQRRLYTIEELAEVFEQVGLRLTDVFDEHGARCAPDDTQLELYVEARK